MRLEAGRRLAGTLAAVMLVALPGCMFKMQHDLPLRTYFNPETGLGRRTHFEKAAMKNWALAGLVPYSDFGAKDLVDPLAGAELSGVRIETVFTGLDTLVWVIPGFAYGYYLWAPRHVELEGDYVQGAKPAIPSVRSVDTTQRHR